MNMNLPNRQVLLYNGQADCHKIGGELIPWLLCNIRGDFS